MGGDERQLAPYFLRILMRWFHDLSALQALEAAIGENCTGYRPESQKNLIMTKNPVAVAKRFFVVRFTFAVSACVISQPMPRILFLSMAGLINGLAKQSCSNLATGIFIPWQEVQVGIALLDIGGI